MMFYDVLWCFVMSCDVFVDVSEDVSCLTGGSTPSPACLARKRFKTWRSERKSSRPGISWDFLRSVGLQLGEIYCSYLEQYPGVIPWTTINDNHSWFVTSTGVLFTKPPQNWRASSCWPQVSCWFQGCYRYVSEARLPVCRQRLGSRSNGFNVSQSTVWMNMDDATANFKKSYVCQISALHQIARPFAGQLVGMACQVSRLAMGSLL